MFHFPTFPPHALCVQARVTPHDWCGVPPFGHPRINARLAAPRGLSQPPTSFIGSWCPGIHRAPLKTWPHKYLELSLQSQKMLASTVQFSTSHRPPPHHTPPAPPASAGGTRPGRPRTRDNAPPPPGTGPLPQDPTACLRPPPRGGSGPPPAAANHGRAVLGAGGAPAAELVSVPPSSTTPHARRHR
jgi:hypothetical protein